MPQKNAGRGSAKRRTGRPAGFHAKEGDINNWCKMCSLRMRRGKKLAEMLKRWRDGQLVKIIGKVLYTGGSERNNAGGG